MGRELGVSVGLAPFEEAPFEMVGRGRTPFEVREVWWGVAKKEKQ